MFIEKEEEKHEYSDPEREWILHPNVPLITSSMEISDAEYFRNIVLRPLKFKFPEIKHVH